MILFYYVCLVQQVLIEQRDFLKSKDIKMGRQLLVLLANGAVFATQFFAIKKMIAVCFFTNVLFISSSGKLSWFSYRRNSVVHGSYYC